MNLANLNIRLQEAIDNSTSTMDYMFLAKAIQALNIGQIRKVASYGALPAAASNEGLLAFVDSENRLYYSNGNGWFNLLDTTQGVAYGWGDNSLFTTTGGTIGDNTIIDKSSPVTVVGNISSWCQVSAASQHSVALASNGTLWSWGLDSQGRLGNNCSTGDVSSPVSVIGGFTDWCCVSAAAHTVALRSNGTLWAWGTGTEGQIGDNFRINRSSPVSVAGGFTDWSKVSAGTYTVLALRSNNTLWAWGFSGSGEVGDDSIIDRSSPVTVVGGFTDWCQISAGNRFSLAIRQDGTLWSWGCNGSGRLGDGTTENKSSPVSVVGGFTDWCQVAAGRGATITQGLGIRSNGTLWAWGNGTNGALGDNTIISKSSPVSVVGGFTDWCSITTGNRSSFGIRTNGTLWAWGCNAAGQLGDDTLTNRSSPVSVVGGFTDWSSVSACSATLAIRRISL